MMRLIFALVVVMASTAFAVEPEEMLADPALEARAREISAELRCPVCQNESIDDSNAPVARDLRLLVRERLVEGDTNDEVITYVTQRFGDYVRLKPTTNGWNKLLWWAAPIAAMIGALAFFGVVKSRPKTDSTAPLSDEEKARLRDILDS